jgi:hypothetical protein
LFAAAAPRYPRARSDPPPTHQAQVIITSTQAPDAAPCLLVNPLSYRASRGLAVRATRMVRAAGLDVHEVTDPASVNACLDVLHRRGVQEIWLLSGDGTVLALAEYLAERAPGWNPALVLLGGGRANVVPRDAGGYPAIPALRRVLLAREQGRQLPEDHITTLRVEQQGQPVRHGFVWGAALVYDAIRVAAESRARGGWWWRTWISEVLILLRWAVRLRVLRRPPPDFGFITASIPGLGEVAGTMRAVVASSLEMRGTLYDPFAARGSGPVRLTAVTRSAPKILRLLPAIRSGRFAEDMNPINGVLSGRGPTAQVTGVSAYALDGELVRADPALPVVLAPGPTLRVLRPVP